MDIATPSTGTRYDTVLRQALGYVRAGDYRARRVTLRGARRPEVRSHDDTPIASPAAEGCPKV